MTPCWEDNTNRETDTKCTFGDEEQRKAQEKISIVIRESRGHGTIELKVVLWVPSLSFRIVSSGYLRREGEEFDDSGMRGGYVTILSNEP